MTLKMKYSKILLITGSLLSAMVINAQNRPVGQIQSPAPSVPLHAVPGAYPVGLPVNYTRTWEPKAPFTKPSEIVSGSSLDTRQTTVYSNGLGDIMQTVIRNGSPLLKDIVVPRLQDEFGRIVYDYLPYVQTTGGNSSDGSLKNDPFNSQYTFYQSDYKDAGNQLMYPGEQVYYSKTSFESSPLNRIDKLCRVGNSWTGSDRGVEQSNLLSLATEGIRVWDIGMDPLTYVNEDLTTNIPVTSSGYDVGKLFKDVLKDEHGKLVVNYKDFDGNMVCNKVQIDNTIASDLSGHNGWLITYYVYDDFGRLRVTIPPKAVEAIKSTWILSSSIVDELCFRYEYDAKNRLIAKKTPGRDWVYMIYDHKDRLVFMQDGNMRGKNQWVTNLYDVLDRTVLTGISIYTSGMVSLMGQVAVAPTGISVIDGMSVSNNPIPASAVFISLVRTFYDNYSWTSKQYTTANNNYLTGGANLHPVPLPANASNQVFGRLTGSSVRVIEDPNNLSVGEWLQSVNFYDEQGRCIQVRSDNYQLGEDVSTNMYNYTGQMLCNYVVQPNPSGATPLVTSLKTEMAYDQEGRLVSVVKTINNDNAKKTLIASYTYDALGRLMRKSLGNKNGGVSSSDPLEIQDFTYNIQGDLKGINAGYTHPELAGGNLQYDRNFGLELSYDWGYERNRINGSLSGIRWRSKGDGEQRSYGFDYDATDRLMSADFNQSFAGAWEKTDPANVNYTINYSVKMGDGTNSLSGYDESGNIKRMQQWGLKGSSSSQLDDLNYEYLNGGNKLKSVRDDIAVNNHLNDFTDNSSAPIEYTYDRNGNQVADLNKRLGEITAGNEGVLYNFLDLAYKMSVKDETGNPKGEVSYIYDATGTKLRKKSIEFASVANGNQQREITIDYIGECVYQKINTNPPQLQFIAHEEGIVRYDPASSLFVYDYFIKDQLSNVRVILTDQQKELMYPAATLEGVYDASTNSMVNYERNFFNINSSLIVEETSIPSWPSAINGDYQNNNNVPNANYPASVVPNQSNLSNRLYKMNGTADKTGLQGIIKVMAGDHINIFGSSYYSGNQTYDNTNSSLLDIATILGGMLLSPGGQVTGKGLTGTDLGLLNGGLIPNSFIRGNNNESSQVPKAYINYLFLDEQFRFVAGSASRVGTSGAVKQHWNDATLQNIEVPKNGYLYVYVSNESNVDVYFDNLQIDHKYGPLKEESHYYPYGLKMAGISSKALPAFEASSPSFGYQGDFSEEVADFDLNYNEFSLRSYDPQVGRWTSSDPYDEFASPYTAMGNDPANTVDPDGGLTAGGWGGLIGAAVGYAAPYIYEGITGNKVKNKGAWGALGAFAGAGLGYGIGESAFGTGNMGQDAGFFTHTRAFYKGLFGSDQSAYSWITRNGQHGTNNSASAPDIWGAFGGFNITLPPLFDWIPSARISWVEIARISLITSGYSGGTDEDRKMKRRSINTIPNNKNNGQIKQVLDEIDITVENVGEDYKTDLEWTYQESDPFSSRGAYLDPLSDNTFRVTYAQSLYEHITYNHYQPDKNQGTVRERRVNVVTSKRMSSPRLRLRIFGIRTFIRKKVKK